MSTHARRGRSRRNGDRRRPVGHAGFTLMEVMVTAAVTVVAFTGLATMQMLALKAAESTLARSQAASLAYEIIDRLRLNRGDGDSASTALGGGYDGATLCNSSARLTTDKRNCTYDSLSDFNNRTDPPALDLRDWWQAIDSAGQPVGSAGLRNWYAGILRTGSLFSVAVQWDDSRAEGEDKPAANAVRTSCLGGDMPAAMQEICVQVEL